MKKTELNLNNKNKKKKASKEIIQNDEKKNIKDKKKVNVIKLIINIVFWVGITVLAIVWLTDFIKIQNDHEPIFCLTEKTHKFDDGTVHECVGLGYKIYDYHRDSLSASHQFSPFFIGMKK